MTIDPNTRPAFGFLFWRMRPPIGRRVAQLIPGLALFGVAMGLALESRLGVGPWTVLHEGIAGRTGLTIGMVTSLVGVLLVILSRPLREPIGLGTALNALLIGPVIDITMWAIPDVDSLLTRIVMLAIAPVLVGVASGLYIGAGLGPGPRDSLMTAAERRGVKVSWARTTVEFAAMTIGWLLGGTVGIGTLWMAGSIGWFVARFLPLLRIDPPPEA